MAASSITFRKERGVADVVNVSFLFIRRRWRILLKSLATLAGLPALLALVVYMAAYIPLFLEIFQAASNPSVLSNPEAFAQTSATTTLIGLLAGMIGYGAVMIAMTTVAAIVRLHDERGDEPIPFEDVRALTFKHVFNVGLGLLLFLVGVLASALLNLIPCLGSIAWVVGIIYFFCSYVFVGIPLMVLEDRPLFKAWKRANKLTKKNIWPTLGIYLVMVIAVSVLGSGFALPGYGFILIGGATAPVSETIGIAIGVLGAAFFGIGYVLSTLSTALVFLAGCFQYYSLAEEREKVSVWQRLNVLEAEVGTDDGSQADAPPSTHAPIASPDADVADEEASEAPDEDAARWGRAPSSETSDPSDSVSSDSEDAEERWGRRPSSGDASDDDSGSGRS